MDCCRICVDILRNEEVDFFKSFTLVQCNKSSIVKKSIRTKLYTLADIVLTCDSSAEFPRMGFNLLFTLDLVLVFISYLLMHLLTLPLLCHLLSVTLSLLCHPWSQPSSSLLSLWAQTLILYLDSVSMGVLGQ